MINPEHDLYGVDIAKEAVEAAANVVGKGRILAISERAIAITERKCVCHNVF